MEQLESSSKRDLHLRFSRRGPVQWEPCLSVGKYVLPSVAFESQHGRIYSQGVFLDKSGRALSQPEVAGLVDAHGFEAINKLEGDFVIAVDDTRDGVWCATDASATLPLYYKLTSHELVISTRSENIRVQSAKDLDVECIMAVLNSGYPWGEVTLLKEWKVLRPGHMIRIDPADNCSTTCYFDPEADQTVQGFKSPDELVVAIDTALMSIASRYKRVLLPLSGGIDSRLIAVRCHALGIPFEAITFVANVDEGADFDIASRLVKVFGVKHHRWQWDPTVENCIENFRQLCIATGGTNDAYTSYTDGMGIFAQVASEFDCIMRGDHVFGLGAYSDTMVQSAYLVAIKLEDDLNWILREPFQNISSIPAVFEEQEGISVNTVGAAANAWRHESYRKSRSPRFILPIGQLQARHIEVTYPFLTKEIISRVSRADSSMRDEKRIAHEALAAYSPPDISRIPFTDQPTWKNGEPLLNLPRDVVQAMIELAGKANVLSEVVNESLVINNYKEFLSGHGRRLGRRGLLWNLKKIAKQSMPKGMLAAYQKKVSHAAKAPPYMIFKRYFAMKVFLDSISQ